MPSLNAKFDSLIGPLISVGVAPAGTINPAAQPNIQITTFPALIDTGASATCISQSVAKTIGLQPMGKQPMTSATQSVPTNVYLVDIVLPFANGGLILNSIQVMEFNTLGGSPFQMLVGRDILCKGIFILSSDGHFSFAI
jgi:predicted aspartyl protease